MLADLYINYYLMDYMGILAEILRHNVNKHNPFSNVTIASAITSYSRIHIGEFIQKLDGECYYSDTDSGAVLQINLFLKIK